MKLPYSIHKEFKQLIEDENMSSIISVRGRFVKTKRQDKHTIADAKALIEHLEAIQSLVAALKFDPFFKVERDDFEYDSRQDFQSYREAKEYADKYSAEWINHYDKVYLCTYHEEIDLSGKSTEEIESLCADYGLRYE